MKLSKFSYTYSSIHPFSLFTQLVLHSLMRQMSLRARRKTGEAISKSLISFPIYFLFEKVMKMKSILFVYCLLFVVSGFLFAQQSREEKIEQLKSRTDIKVTEIEKDILKIEYPQGKVMYKNVGDYIPNAENRVTYSPTYDSTIIDLTTIDTTLYYHKYSFWQEVPLSNFDYNFLRIEDVNNNGKPELYGARKFFTTPIDQSEPVTVYELNESGIFEEIFQYDSILFMKNIYDVNKEGNYEIHALGQHIDSVDTNLYQLVNIFPFFKKSSDTSLAKELSFVFEPWRTNSQQNDNYLGDWDGDQYTDQIFIAPCCPPRINIYEYNPLIPNFDSVYQFDYSSLDLYYGGFAIGDFDDDGNTEFLAGSVHGKVLAIENCGNNCYTTSWQGMVETYNAYLLAETDDLDRNGKKEIWIGGDAYYNGIGTTRITILEADGDNSYQMVGRIDLVGVMSFYAGNIQAIDIDKDGTDEIAICIDENFLILKFNGSRNHHTYEVYYIKKNELSTEEEFQVYFGATMYDLLDDGEYEILISIAHTIQAPYIMGRYVTKIYKPDSLASVIYEADLVPNSNNLNQNYPNPFNPSTKISFEINQFSITSIKVFNVLGKEITTLLEKELSPGSYSIDWEAKDGNGQLLPSGVYLIRLSANNRAGNYTQTIKALLLK